MICLTYCFPFFSIITTLFDIVSCIFKLKDLIVLIPSYSFPSLNWVINLGHSVTYGNREVMHTKKNLFGHDHTNEFIDSFQFCVSLIPLYSYLRYPLLVITFLVIPCYPNFHVFFLHTYCKWLTRFHDLITTYYPSFGVILLIITPDVMNPYFLLMNPFLSFQTRVFFKEKS